MSNVKSSVQPATQNRDDLQDLKSNKTLVITGGVLEYPGVPTDDEITAFKDKTAVTVESLGSLDFQPVNKAGSNFSRIARIHATIKADKIARKGVFPIAIAAFSLNHSKGLVMVQVVQATAQNADTGKQEPIATKSGRPIYNYQFSMAEGGEPSLSREELATALQNATVAETETVGG